MKETAEDRRFEERLDTLRERLAGLRRTIEARFLGHAEAVDLLLATLLADGHALIEGAPGLGKTTLVRLLSRAVELSFSRIQFTPDLMPADILGTRILEETPDGGHAFRFERGPIFAHVLLADEINRATPRTQSAMLEAMQERQVTVFGETLVLEEPFLVIATQNPIEMEGTYPLPEAQVDRFLCKIELDSPDEDALVDILQATTGAPPAATAPALSRDEVLELRSMTRQVEASDDLVRRIARLICLTDPRRSESPESVRRHLRYGASPRGAQALLLLGKARALLAGRPWVSEDDVAALAAPALRHRLVFSYEGEASGVHADRLVADAWEAARRD
jgi:MoxR-like ATPase